MHRQVLLDFDAGGGTQEISTYIYSHHLEEERKFHQNTDWLLRSPPGKSMDGS